MRFRLCSIVVVLVGLVGSASAQTDRDALIAFYNSTGGENWANNTNWNSEEDISTWFGITAVGGRVTEISMRDNGLSGTLPPEIGDLSALTLLALRDNSLTGSIPDEVGNLSAMVRLDLRENSLTGPIPSTLQQLSNLEVLFLRVNSLSGPVPGWLSGLSNLTILDLSQNALTGSIPADIGRLSSLSLFNLSNNPVTGELPSSLTSITTLRNVTFSNTQLSGQLRRTWLQLPTCMEPNGCNGVGIFQFNYGNTGLCAPADEEFTAWIAGIWRTTTDARCAAVPVLPGLGSLLLSLLLAGLGARGIRRLGSRCRA